MMRRQLLADVIMRLLRHTAEFQHIAHDRDFASRHEFRQRLDSRRHRHRARVIGIINHMPIFNVLQFKAHLRRLELTESLLHLCWGQAERKTAGDGRQSVVDVVPPHHRDSIVVRLTRITHSKGRLLARRTDMTALHIGTLLEAKGHDLDLRLGLSAHACHIFIICIEDNRTARRDSLHQLAFGLGNILQRPQKLHMGLTHIGHNTDLWRGNRCHRLNLVEPTHTDFHHGRRMFFMEP